MASDLESLFEQIKNFSDDRDWAQFHTPKNLILAIVAEVGELAEVVQWQSEQEISEYLSSPEGKSRISEEIADVAIYLIRLCQQRNLDFLEIVKSKLAINAIKYPIQDSKGNSKKYSELRQK
jgi:dCTP diphosphatase